MKQWKRKADNIETKCTTRGAAQKRQARSRLSREQESQVREVDRQRTRERRSRLTPRVSSSNRGTDEEQDQGIENDQSTCNDIFAGLASHGFLDGLDNTNGFIEISEEVKQQIYQRCCKAIRVNTEEELVCAVCDCLCPRSNIIQKDISKCSSLIDSMRRRLKVANDLPNELRAFYDCSSLSNELQNMMLSKKGVKSVQGNAVLNLCRSCNTSLNNKSLQKPPKFAIANGLFIGVLPSKFDDTTLTENAMLNLTQPSRFLSVVRGGKHSVIRSHAYLFRALPDPPAQLLPREIVSSGSFRVTMVGAMTSAQKIATYKKYEVRWHRLQHQLQWYLANNHMYAATEQGQELVDDTIQFTRVVVDRTVDEAESGDTNSDDQEEQPKSGIYGKPNSTGTSKKSESQEIADCLDNVLARFNTPGSAGDIVTAEEEIIEQVASGIVTSHNIEGNDEAIQRVLELRDVVVYRSNVIQSDFDPKYWALSFCELYPFGRGGLDENREIKIGLEEYVRYCLRLSSRRHARHPTFMLIAFDVIARHRALNAVYIKAKLSPAMARSAANTDRDALLAHCLYKQARLEAFKNNKPPPLQPAVSQSVQDLYSGISTGMRAYWGSNEEKTQSRADLMSMMMFLGQPAIFFTISPCSSTTLSIAYLSGDFKPSFVGNVENELNNQFQVSKALLGKIATENPVACAKYFNRVMNMFVDTILNWDVQSNSPRVGGGIFGYTKAYFGAVESQNSTGDLHCHMLIWVHGLPSTVDEYYVLLRSQDFKDRVKRYVGSITTASVPIGASLECPSCKALTLQPVAFTHQHFQRPSKNAYRPPTTVCGQCSATYGGSELLDARIKEKIDDDSRILLSEGSIFQQIAHPEPLQLPTDSTSNASLIFSKALLTFQHHRWTHSVSCFKKTKRTPTGKVCRMFFPKSVCPELRWTSDDTLELDRAHGNEYVNGYIPLIAAIFKTNHDVKFLAAGEGPEKGFYMVKYSTKEQNSVENLAALHANAFDKASRADLDASDTFKVGTHHIRSMLCSLSNAQEVSAPLAALYLDRESAVYSSHSFVKLFLESVERAVNNDGDIDVLLSSDPSALHVSSQYLDYIYRPNSLEELCLAEYIQLWEKRRSKTGIQLLQSHPQQTTHTITRRKLPVMITVVHARLPDISQPDTTDDSREKYYRHLMTLFHPFRDGAGFPRDYCSLHDIFHQWWESSPPEAKNYAKYGADYYMSRRISQTRTDIDVERYRSIDGECEYDLEVSGYNSIDDKNDDDEDVDDDELDGAHYGPMVQGINLADIDKSSSAATLTALSSGKADYHFIGRLDIETIDRMVEEDTTAQVAESTVSEIEMDRQIHQTRVELQTELKSSEWTPLDEVVVPTELPLCPSLQNVSQFFRLNKKQHQIFDRVGTKLLQSLNVTTSSNNQQMIAFLGGLPGAGKSQVIKALQVLANNWNYPEAQATVAFQGVAAQAANGDTIHRLFGWGLHGPTKNWKPNQRQKERFARLRLLIIDEVSTTDVKLLGMIDTALRVLLDRPNHLFGGIDVLLVGDWLQQLPVCGVPSYVNEPPCAQINRRQEQGYRDSPTYLSRLKGIEAYKCITDVVMLSENMRHRADATWRDILARWRLGLYKQEDLDIVNSQCYHENWQSAPTLHAYCPILVTSNALRVAFNEKSTQEFCVQQRETLHRYSALVSRPKNPLTCSQKRSLRTIRDDKTGNLAMVLNIAVGMPVQCTKNLSKRFRLANGTIGIVVGIQDAPGDSVDSVDNDGVRVSIHSVLPEVVYIKLLSYIDIDFVPGLPSGVVPVRPRAEKGVKVEIMQDRCFAVSVTQIPLVPAFSLTTEKCQGLTVEKMILGPLRHASRTRPQRSAFYVAVTRVRTLRQLYLMEPLNLLDLEYFKPVPDALQETQRLERMETQL